MSNLDILRQASQEVDLETSMTSLDGLLDSVQEVAIERGFKSPDRQRSLDSLQSPSHTTGRPSSPTVRGDLNRMASQNNMHSPRRASPAGKIDGGGGSPRTSKATTSPPPRGASALSSPRHSSSATVAAAGSSTGPETHGKTTSNIPPQKGLYGKTSHFGRKDTKENDGLDANERIDDDLNAMVKSLKSEGIVDNGFKLKPKQDNKFVERKKQALHRYNQNKNRHSEADGGKSTARLTTAHTRSEPSRISQLLDKYEPDELEKTPMLTSYTQEMLFRSMKLLEPKDAGKSTRGKDKLSRVSANDGKGKSIRDALCQPKESHVYGRHKNKDGLHPTQIHATYDGREFSRSYHIASCLYHDIMH